MMRYKSTLQAQRRDDRFSAIIRKMCTNTHLNRKHICMARHAEKKDIEPFISSVRQMKLSFSVTVYY